MKQIKPTLVVLEILLNQILILEQAGEDSTEKRQQAKSYIDNFNL